MKRIAVVQKAPVFMDKEKTISKAVACVEEAKKEGAELVVFAETFIPGYPTWIWRLRPGTDWKTNDSLYQRLLKNSVSLQSNDLKPLYLAAKKHRVAITCGIQERDSGNSQTSVFNSYVTIGTDGAIQNVHRKMMPTNPERMVWGVGDAAGLKVVNTSVGRVGSLICWENFMPLARYALFAQGVEIYIAPTYDSGPGWIGSLQHIAREGRCYVVGVGNLLQGKDLVVPEKEQLYPDQNEWVNPGDSVIVAPNGDILGGPFNKQDGIFYADIDIEQVAAARRALDVAGHYARPDIFSLKINANRPAAITISHEED